MDKKENRIKGVKVAKGQSALEALRNALPHWVHETKEDPSYVTGFYYLPGCKCSECGFKVSYERPYCPHCGSKMQKMKGI